MDIPAPLMDALHDARRVVVLTGAGMSAESGVPTFRDALTGLWARYRPEELATPEAFARHPKLVWDWYAWRRDLVAKARPNAGHVALARMAERFADFTLVTQNVDGLHQRAGSRDVVELHGRITRIRCSRGCGAVATYPEAPAPPPCPRCGAPLRPDVVWFGELLPPDALARATAAAATCDLFLSVGTSTLVYPAAELPSLALRSGATLVEINPEETPLTSQARFTLAGPAGVLLPRILAGLREGEGA